METPLQLTFHQLPSSAALEVDVNRWVAELEECFDGIVSCRVVIDAPHHHHHKGRRYRVHVELGVPRGPIVVDRPTDENGAHEDPYVAIRDTFLAARRRLEDHVHRLRGEVKDHHLPPHGRVVHLEPDRTYGRLSDDEGREIYFHRNSVIGGIDRLALGAEVRFHEERGDEGPQASTVEPIGANGHHREAFS
jgi:cold shock CspA family protein